MALRRMESRRSLAMKVENAGGRRRETIGRGLRKQEAGLAVGDGFGKAAGLMPDRQRSEPLCVHLAQSARLEARGHQGEIAAGENPPGLAVVKADRDPDRIRPAATRIDQCLLDRRLAASGDDDLPAGLDDFVGSGEHEIDALLVHEAGDQTEDRAARYRKTKLLADVIRIGALAVPVAGAEGLCELRAKPRIPAFVDAVQYSRQLRRVGADPEQALEAAAEFVRRDLPRIGAADGGQMRGVDDAALEKGQLVVELDAVDVKRALRRADPAQRLLGEDAR